MSMRLVAQTQDVKNDLSNENIKAHHNTTERSRTVEEVKKYALCLSLG